MSTATQTSNSSNISTASIIDGNTTVEDDAPTTKVLVGLPASTSPVVTKAKSNESGSTKFTTTPLTVTVNGNDRSKDLNEHDVVCEKGRGDHERWPGNKLYRHLINVNKDSYNDLAPIERSNVIGKIISTIQEKDGWFVTHSEATGKWARLTEDKVRKKVSDDLRREVRRRREKRSHNSLFSAKLRAIKEMEEVDAASRDILERVDDPRQTDVLFGPGARRHPGNKTYWHHMKLNLDQYIISPYGARSVISQNIVQIIRSQHGRFLEQDPKTGIWYSISDKRALEKTSHALSNMKYKTRKRHPDEPPAPHMYHPQGVHPHHHLVYTVGPYGGHHEGIYDDDEIEGEKILEGDSPNTIYAKKRTKKFRLLNRMDDVERTPLKGNEPNADAVAPNSTGTEKSLTVKTKTINNSTTPVSGGKIISPNSSQADVIEFQEQRNPNASYPRVDHPATGMPSAATPGYRGDIAPLIGHFNYAPAGLGGAAFKTLTYAAGMRGDEYAPPHHHPHARYFAPNLVPEQPRSTPSSSGKTAAYDQARRVLQSTGPAGYWVSNDWAPAPEYY